ncbi:uncharacterized protein LOC143573177 [Bidens hawaiensis]|uniref:uncharacterized protein LOC143573177 n=1 Tax=Bidens hawaiensis TaxID=980011 RepID=UPI004049478D
MALLAKWWFKYNNSRRVITAVHTNIQEWRSFPVKKSLGGTWNKIGCLEKDDDLENMKLGDRLQINLGMGDKTMFWLDNWVSELPLKVLFRSLFLLEKHKDIMVQDCYYWVNNEVKWLWRWNRGLNTRTLREELGRCLELISLARVKMVPDVWVWKDTEGKENTFLVKALRWELDNFKYPLVEQNFWIQWVPIKVNCFMWRLLLDRIATKTALLERRINIGNDTCVLCGLFPESSEHLMVKCRVAKWIWSIIHNWIKIPVPTHYESVLDLMDLSKEHKGKKEVILIIQATSFIMCWMIWRTRNDRIFKNLPVSVGKVINDIKATSFLWVKHRMRRSSLDWEDWCRFNFVNFPL